MSRKESTVRELLLERRIIKLEEQIRHLKGETEMQYNSLEEPEIIEVGLPTIQQRQLNMIAGIDGRMEYGKLNVYAWCINTQSIDEEFRLGYFLDPLIKTCSFSYVYLL